jgi:hypothetical protein
VVEPPLPALLANTPFNMPSDLRPFRHATLNALDLSQRGLVENTISNALCLMYVRSLSVGKIVGQLICLFCVGCSSVLKNDNCENNFKQKMAGK